MSSKADKNDQDFAAKYARLEEIVQWFSTDQINIDESLKKFEEGTELAKELKSYLSKTENKVEKIRAKFDN